MPGDRHTKDAQTLDRYSSQYRELTTRLEKIGFIWGGSIQTQWVRCGKPGCACAENPENRHGPYVYWTTKKQGRTVTRLLHSPEAEVLAEWVKNRQEVDRILQEMKQLSHRALKIVLRLRVWEMRK
jgi:hypothetical protein